MKRPPLSLYLTLTVLALGIVLSAFFRPPAPAKKHYAFPYKQAGLTERQAAAHLLNRFTYGATPGEVDQLMSMGLEKWFEQQLNASIPDDSLDRMLEGYDAINLSNTQVMSVFPRNGEVIRMAVRDGVVDKDSVKTDKKEYKDIIKAYMAQKGYKPEQELYRQFICQKILRAAYTNNQLQEVLTDFWFNHFNVSVTKNDCAAFIPAYERDVVRPNALGKFDQLLIATAQSPAMLYYLDNFTSAVVDSNAQRLKRKNNQGINENYAREVMELHTLGVDGGYTQQDVTQAARVLTGWTVYPIDSSGYGAGIRKMLDRIGPDNLEKRGFVHEGDFLFAANRHDTGEKTVLGKEFPAGGGYQEGVDLLEMLAHHPSTAKFIAREIAVRFVNDDPPQALVDKMAKTFIDRNGDIKQVLITMVCAPEFWSASALRSKIKSPFELAISTVRGLHATITQPYPLYQWITRMGQKMYYYQAPTGFPDKGQYWINTGSLLNRMNFGLALASRRIQGITFDLNALNNNHEPESAGAGLIVYGKLLMPERNLDQTVKQLSPMLNEPDLVTKVDAAAGKAPANQDVGMAPRKQGMTAQNPGMQNQDMAGSDAMASRNQGMASGDAGMASRSQGLTYADAGMTPAQEPGHANAKAVADNNSMLSQVVGILIGSPEYQRR